jgi:hypothetical protein
MRIRGLGILVGCIATTGLLLSMLVREARGTGGTVAVNPPGAGNPPVAQCKSDAQCSDGRFCNGVERCAPGPSSDTRGCTHSSSEPCTANQTCYEHSDKCCDDRDGDGHPAADCGGDDCDDGDAARYPGNTEVCDPSSRDEDCNPVTFGPMDSDGDGEDDARCCNMRSGDAWICGTDFDDSRYEVRRGSQVCDGVKVFTDRFVSAACPQGTVCIPQPNGQGVCGVAPAGYTAPPAFVAPLPFDRRPPLQPQPIVKPRKGPIPAQSSRPPFTNYTKTGKK